jgi:hypothetical protein
MLSPKGNAEKRKTEGGVLSEEIMRGYWFKEYADLGHWFNTAHDRCIRCGTPTIDLYEDGVYGDVRPCKKETTDGTDRA